MTWCTMIAFAYRSGDPEDGNTDIRESFKEVEHRARVSSVIASSRMRALRQTAGRKSTVRVHFGSSHGSMASPSIPRCAHFVGSNESMRRSFDSAHPVELDGQIVRGRMEVYFGIVLIAEIALTVEVNSAAQAAEPEREVRSVGRPYRKIFASYSHKDRSIVSQVEEFTHAFGDEFVRDWTNLKAGQIWSTQLQRMISESDVFQLFWSKNSMASDFVRQEWEFALGLNRPNFIRPVYWEDQCPRSRIGIYRLRHYGHCTSTGSRQPWATPLEREESGPRKRSPGPLLVKSIPPFVRP